MCFILSCVMYSQMYILFNTVLTNLALGKDAYQTDSRQGAAGQASNAVDGNLAQRFQSSSCTHSESEDAIWEVDLGHKAVIDHVIIYNRADCCGKSTTLRFIYLTSNNFLITFPFSFCTWDTLYTL